ncbi:MAG: hypothetical protein Q8P68_00680 [Candidatus Peregrinibacteria bacterium]|nr:hypothetical protein [Candidatus Peregrinibacteria bacterium]MDZ4245066.1 hypothetical protein [Candidatus Gracilibacteria bacterium]
MSLDKKIVDDKEVMEIIKNALGLGESDLSNITPILPAIDSKAILAKFDEETASLQSNPKEAFTLPDFNDLEVKSDIEEEKTRISEIKAQHAKTLYQLAQSVTKREKIAVQAEIEREKAIIEYLDTLISAYESMLIVANNKYEYKTLYERTAAELKTKIEELDSDIQALKKSKQAAESRKETATNTVIRKLKEITWLQSEKPSEEIKANNTLIDTLTRELEEKATQRDAADTNLQTVRREFNDIKVSPEEEKLNEARDTIAKRDEEIKEIEWEITKAVTERDYGLMGTKAQECLSKIAEKEQAAGTLADLMKQMLGKPEEDITNLSEEELEAKFNTTYAKHLDARRDIQCKIETLNEEYNILDRRIEEIEVQISKTRKRNIDVQVYLNDVNLVPKLHKDKEAFLAEEGKEATIIDELEERISTLDELKKKLDEVPVNNDERELKADDFRTNTLEPSQNNVDVAIKLVKEKRTLAETIDKEVMEIILFSSEEARNESLVRRLTDENRKILRAQLVATLSATSQTTEVSQAVFDELAQLVATLSAASQTTKASQAVFDELTQLKESIKIRNVRQNRLITALMVAALLLVGGNFFSEDSNNTSLTGYDDRTEEEDDDDNDTSAENTDDTNSTEKTEATTAALTWIPSSATTPTQQEAPTPAPTSTPTPTPPPATKKAKAPATKKPASTEPTPTPTPSPPNPWRKPNI